MTAASVASVREYPAFFPAGKETLSGVFSAPSIDGGLPAVIVLGGGGTTPTATGRNRFFVTLCRRITGLGYPALRFDYHGLGDSTGKAEFRLDRPFLEDLAGAVSWVDARGSSRYVLVGMCFGARTALSGPALAGLGGLALLAPPVRDYALSEPKTSGWRLRDYVMAALHPRRLLGAGERLTVRRYFRFSASGARMVLRRVRARLPGRRDGISWVSRRFLGPLLSLAEQGVPVLLLYGTEDDEYRDFESARMAGLGEILARCPTIEVRTLEGQVHGFTRVESQGLTMDVVVEWIERVAPPERPR